MWTRINTRRGLILVSLGLASLFAGSPGAAQLPADADSNKVSIHATNLPFQLALTQIFRAVEKPYDLDPTLQKMPDRFLPSGTVTMRVDQMPLNQLLTSLLHCQGLPTPLTYEIKNGVYVLHIDPSGRLGQQPNITYHPPRTQPEPALEPLLSMEMQNAPFDSALYEVFRLGGQKYRIALDVPPDPGPVSMGVERVPIKTALEALLHAVSTTGTPLRYEVKDGVYIISRDPAKPASPPKIASDLGKNAEKISLRLTGASLQEALKQVFAQSKADYACVLPADLSARITLSLDKVSLATALTAVLRSVDSDPPFTQETQNGIIIVHPLGNPLVSLDATAQQRLMLRFDQVKAWDACWVLGQLARVDFTLDPQVRTLQSVIHISVEDVTFEQALVAVVHHAHPRLDLEVDNGVYNVIVP